MGLFDTIILKCPNCKGILEFQSKGGECILKEYNEKNVSWNVMLAVNGKVIKCENCLKNIKLIIKNLPKKPQIRLQVK